MTVGKLNYHSSTAIFFLIFPVIISNSRMRDTLPGHKYFGLLSSVPTYISFGLSFIILVGVITLIKRSEELRFLICIYILIATVIFSSLINSIGLQQTIQGIFYFIVPILIFTVIKSIESHSFSLDRSITFLIQLSKFNLPVAFFLYLKYTLPMDWSKYNPLDAVSGWFAESHAYAFFILLIILLLLYKLRQRRSAGLIALLLAHIFLFVVTYNEKLILLSLGTGFLFLVVYGRIGLKYKLGSMLIIAISLIYVFNMVKQRLGNILASKDVSELPVIEAFSKMRDIYTDKPIAMIYGVGFGEYGTVIVNSNVKNGYFPKIAKKYNYYPIMRVNNPEMLPKSILARYASSIQISFNTFTSFLIEIGLIPGIAYFYALYLMFRPMGEAKDNHKDLYRLLFFYITVVILYSLVSMFGSFDDFVPMVPLVVLLGFLNSETNYERKNSLYTPIPSSRRS